MASSRRLPAIGVLCSGQGTNLQAILNAARSRRVRARIGLVISDRADAFALRRAKRAGVPAVFVDRMAFGSREAFERHLVALLEHAGVRLVCLAGFMRVLSPVFVRRFRWRILNIHPSLLPAFPGGHAVRDAVAWGAKVTGVTVHLVDEEVDHGPILLQESLVIKPGEREGALLERIHRIEHRLYPEAIRLMLGRTVRVRGRTVTVR